MCLSESESRRKPVSSMFNKLRVSCLADAQNPSRGWTFAHRPGRSLCAARLTEWVAGPGHELSSLKPEWPCINLPVPGRKGQVSGDPIRRKGNSPRHLGPFTGTPPVYGRRVPFPRQHALLHASINKIVISFARTSPGRLAQGAEPPIPTPTPAPDLPGIGGPPPIPGKSGVPSPCQALAPFPNDRMVPVPGRYWQPMSPGRKGQSRNQGRPWSAHDGLSGIRG
jgi:hypothetical protein